MKQQTLVKAKRQRGWMGVALFILVLSLACQAASPTATPLPTSDLLQEDQAYLRLLERYLSPPYATPPELYAQGLPEDIPLSIPIPKGGLLLGTVVRRLTRDREYVQVFINTSLSREDAVAFYTEQFAEMGWEAPTYGEDTGGFVEAGTPVTKVLCPTTSRVGTEVEQSTLTITAHSFSETRITDVNISIPGIDRYSACRATEQLLLRGGGGQDFSFPRLEAPEGADVTGSSGEGRDSYQSIDARVVTNLSLRETEAHYREQLAVAGWELLRVGDSDAEAWSAWLVPEETPLDQRLWVGMLGVRYADLPSEDASDDVDARDAATPSVSVQVVTTDEYP